MGVTGFNNCQFQRLRLKQLLQVRDSSRRSSRICSSDGYAGAAVLDSLPHGSFFRDRDLSSWRLKIGEVIPYEAIVGLSNAIVATIL